VLTSNSNRPNQNKLMSVTRRNSKNIEINNEVP